MLDVCLSVFLYLSVCPFVRLSVCPLFCLSALLLVCLPVRLLVRFICFFVYHLTARLGFCSCLHLCNYNRLFFFSFPTTDRLPAAAGGLQTSAGGLAGQSASRRWLPPPTTEPAEKFRRSQKSFRFASWNQLANRTLDSANGHGTEQL